MYCIFVCILCILYKSDNLFYFKKQKLKSVKIIFSFHFYFTSFNFYSIHTILFIILLYYFHIHINTYKLDSLSVLLLLSLQNFQKILCSIIFRIKKHFFWLSLFDNFSICHKYYPVAYFSCETHFVSYYYHCHSFFC